MLVEGWSASEKSSIDRYVLYPGLVEVHPKKCTACKAANHSEVAALDKCCVEGCGVTLTRGVNVTRRQMTHYNRGFRKCKDCAQPEAKNNEEDDDFMNDDVEMNLP